jgi:hypothetical protein
MRNKHSARFVGGSALLAVLGLVAAIFGLRAKRAHSVAPTLITSAQAHGETSTNKASLEELKALVARVHPGMDVAGALEEAERRIDLNSLPLVDRKERLARDIARYEGESRDRNWATSNEERLTTAFAIVSAESIFELRDVQCKTSTCLATIGWGTPEIGQAAYQAILSTPVALGCRLQMLPPDSGALEAVAFLDCAEQRRQSEEAVPMVAEVSGPIPMRPEGSTALHSGP